MSIRKLILLAATCALSLLGATAGGASASTFAHAGTTTGNILAAGTSVMPRSSDVFTASFSGLGSVTCASGTGSATVGASGGATITAAGDSVTFTSCTDTIPVITITGCHLVAPLPTATVTATSSAGGTVSFTNTFVRCNVAGGTSGCYYSAPTATGTAVNTNAALTYSGVSILHTVPAGGSGDLGSLCGTSGTFGGSFTDLTSGATSTTVVLNQTA